MITIAYSFREDGRVGDGWSGFEKSLHFNLEKEKETIRERLERRGYTNIRVWKSTKIK